MPMGDAIVGGLIAGFFSTTAVWLTLRGERNADNTKRTTELAALRVALHTEVALVAGACLLEYRSWSHHLKHSSSLKDAQSAILPPLTIYTSAAGVIGQLSRNEIVALIGFAGTVFDIGVVARNMLKDESRAPQTTMLDLLSNACGRAVECLSAIPVPDPEKDARFLAALKIAYEERRGERMRAREELLGQAE